LTGSECAGHVFARHDGTSGTTRMLLIGHTDTVFEPDSPFQTFSRVGDSATGSGVISRQAKRAAMLMSRLAAEPR